MACRVAARKCPRPVARHTARIGRNHEQYLSVFCFDHSASSRQLIEQPRRGRDDGASAEHDNHQIVAWEETNLTGSGKRITFVVGG